MRRVTWMALLGVLTFQSACAGGLVQDDRVPDRPADGIGQPAAEGDAAPVALAIEAFCSERTPGESAMRLVWPATAEAAGETALEVTVYKSGFDQALYTRLAPVTEEGRFVAPAETSSAYANEAGAAALPEALFPRVVQVAAGSVGTGLELAVDPGTAVVLEGLEPGLYYRWRLVSDGRVVATGEQRAAICPLDDFREEGVDR